MNFIELYSTKEEALSTRYSPLVSIYNYRGIHLLPNSDIPYIQVTENPNGVNIEDWEVFLVSVCGNQRTEITQSFDVISNFDDDLGNPQIAWSLTFLPDVGSGLFYIEANQVLSPGNYAATYYSNPFECYEDERGETSRIDYRDDVYEIMQSVQLNIFFEIPMISQEYTSYMQASKRNQVTVTASQVEYERWQSGYIPRELAIKILKLNTFTYCYLNLRRYFPMSVPEIPEKQGQENCVYLSMDINFTNEFYEPLPNNAELPEFYITNSKIGRPSTVVNAYAFNPPTSRNIIPAGEFVEMRYLFFYFNTDISINSGSVNIQKETISVTIGSENIDVVNGNIMRVNLQSTGQSIQLQAGDSLFFSMNANLVQGHNGVIPPPYNYINITT